MEKNKRKGFTLVELVIVIAVIAVLAAILIPTFMTVMDKSKFSADVQTARNMSTLTKTAAMNGATDADGNDIPEISMNETSGVVAVLKANGFNLVPKSKNAAFWYNRATGDVQVIKNEDIFTTTASAGKIGASMPILNASSHIPAKNAEIGSPEAEFKQDCLEALIKEKPAYVYIDQSDKNPLTKAIKSINNLVPAPAQGAPALDFTQITESMTTTFSASVLLNNDVKKILNVKSDSTPSSAWTHLLEFSPAESLYISSNGAYTTKNFASDTTPLHHALFTQGATTFGSWVEVAPEELRSQALTFANPISIPVAINDFRLNAMTTIDPKTTIIINKKYSENLLYGSGCKATVVDNTGKIQITHKILKYDTFSYDQYGVRYFDYNVVDSADATKDTTNFVSRYDLLRDFPTGNTALNTIPLTDYGLRGENGTSYKKAKSVYAVPNIAISPTLNDGTPVDLKPITGNKITMDFKYYSRNAGNLTVMYGSIISGNNIYKIQDVAYIKSVSTYVISKSGIDTFVVSDPLAGGYYYNLGGIKVFAVNKSGVETSMNLQQYGSSKGDFELPITAGIQLKEIEKIYVKDISGNVILVQYL